MVNKSKNIESEFDDDKRKKLIRDRLLRLKEGLDISENLDDQISQRCLTNAINKVESSLKNHSVDFQQQYYFTLNDESLEERPSVIFDFDADEIAKVLKMIS